MPIQQPVSKKKSSKQSQRDLYKYKQKSPLLRHSSEITKDVNTKEIIEQTVHTQKMIKPWIITHKYSASHYLLKQLGCIFPTIPPKCASFHHQPKPDTNFGSLNNWNNPICRVRNFNTKYNNNYYNYNSTSKTRYNLTKHVSFAQLVPPIKPTKIPLPINLHNFIKNHINYATSHPREILSTITKDQIHDTL